MLCLCMDGPNGTFVVLVFPLGVFFPLLSWFSFQGEVSILPAAEMRMDELTFLTCEDCSCVLESLLIFYF